MVLHDGGAPGIEWEGTAVPQVRQPHATAHAPTEPPPAPQSECTSRPFSPPTSIPAHLSWSWNPDLHVSFHLDPDIWPEVRRWVSEPTLQEKQGVLVQSDTVYRAAMGCCLRQCQGLSDYPQVWPLAQSITMEEGRSFSRVSPCLRRGGCLWSSPAPFPTYRVIPQKAGILDPRSKAFTSPQVCSYWRFCGFMAKFNDSPG